MCWIYPTQTICSTCRAIQPSTYTLIPYRNPNCEKDCPIPWPEGEVVENPELGFVTAKECGFCTRVQGEVFLKEKQGQEDYVRMELERMRGLFAERVEGKRKRRERRGRRGRKKEWRETGREVEVERETGEPEHDDQTADDRQMSIGEPVGEDIRDHDSDKQEFLDDQTYRPEITDQGEGDTRPRRAYETRQRPRI